MSETTDQMLANISKNIGVDEDQLTSLARLAGEQELMEKQIVDMEAHIKEQKEKLRRMKTETIPDFMDELGMESFALRSGAKVTVKPFYQGSIPKDRRDEAFTWLSNHGYEDIIKVDVSFKFGKSQYDEAVALCKELDELGYSTMPAMSVHAMTLKGWIRSMAEDGAEFPHDLFGAFIGRTTDIKVPKT